MRKTHAAIMAVVLALGCAANAQAEFRIGPRLGMNINKLSFDKNILDGSNRLEFLGRRSGRILAPDRRSRRRLVGDVHLHWIPK